MRGRWTFAVAILSVVSVVESNVFDVDVDSAMMSIGGFDVDATGVIDWVN